MPQAPCRRRPVGGPTQSARVAAAPTCNASTSFRARRAGRRDARRPRLLTVFSNASVNSEAVNSSGGRASVRGACWCRGGVLVFGGRRVGVGVRFVNRFGECHWVRPESHRCGRRMARQACGAALCEHCCAGGLGNTDQARSYASKYCSKPDRHGVKTAHLEIAFAPPSTLSC